MRSGENDGAAGVGLHVLKLFHMPAPDSAFVGSDAADVIRIIPRQIAVQVVQGHLHFAGVFLIHAKNDGFIRATGLFQEVGKMFCHSLSAGAQGYATFKIGGGVFLVGNFPAIAVKLVPARSPASGIPLGDDSVNTIGGKKTVLNSLPQTVLIYRIAEIHICIPVFFAHGRGGQTELTGRGEVFENFPPVGLCSRAAAMAFVYDNEIEEVGGELFIEAGAISILGDGLVG